MWRFGGGSGKQRPLPGQRGEGTRKDKGPGGMFDQTILPSSLASRLQKTGPGDNGCPFEKSLLLKMSRLFIHRAGDEHFSPGIKQQCGANVPVSLGRTTWHRAQGLPGVLRSPLRVPWQSSLSGWAGGQGRRSPWGSELGAGLARALRTGTSTMYVS